MSVAWLGPLPGAACSELGNCEVNETLRVFETKAQWRIKECTPVPSFYKARSAKSGLCALLFSTSPKVRGYPTNAVVEGQSHAPDGQEASGKH